MAKEPNLEVIANDIHYIKRDVAEIKANQQAHYVTKEEFEPIKRIVYGLVGLIMVGVVGAVMSLIFRQNGN